MTSGESRTDATGPYGEVLSLLDGEYLGEQVLRHFGLPEERGYTDLGRVRVTVERLEEEKA
jgi:hypothetical protein